MQYRMTVRYVGRGAQRYHVEDIEAESLADAMAQSATRIPIEARASADLVEIRRQVDPERREYTPG